MKNLSNHVDLPCELLTLLLIRGIQMGEMSKLGWLIGLVKHAIWADSFYFLYLLLSVSKILASGLCMLLSIFYCIFLYLPPIDKARSLVFL
jgi:hypothetical protein